MVAVILSAKFFENVHHDLPPEHDPIPIRQNKPFLEAYML